MKFIDVIFTLGMFAFIVLLASLTYDKPQTTVERQLEWIIALLAIIYARDVTKDFDKE